MAVLVFTNAHLHINGVDLSDHVRSVTLEYFSEILDGTCFSADTTRTKVAGFVDCTLTVEFLMAPPSTPRSKRLLTDTSPCAPRSTPIKTRLMSAQAKRSNLLFAPLHRSNSRKS